MPWKSSNVLVVGAYGTVGASVATLLSMREDNSDVIDTIVLQKVQRILLFSSFIHRLLRNSTAIVYSPNPCLHQRM